MASKIKKLTKLSLEIIKTYGLSYYLHVALEELESQKLDILRSDNTKIQKLENMAKESNTEKYNASAIVDLPTPLHQFDLFLSIPK